VLRFDLELMLSDLKAAAGFVALMCGVGRLLLRRDRLPRDFVTIPSFPQALLFGFVVELFVFGFAPARCFLGLGGALTVRARLDARARSG
jgi:hypothetical protein